MEHLNKKRKFSLFDTYFSFVLRRHESDRLLFTAVLLCVVGSLFFAVILINNTYITTVPTQGGTLVEGIVGTPRFVNPVLAINRADHDMVALIYSGLLKIDEQGNLVNDVAESITLSEDGKTYIIKLRNDVRFHNGKKLTAKDVVFTISLIQNPELKSPLLGNWDGVLVEELGENELHITLQEAYAPFAENLTVGILPHELWDDLPIEQIPFSQNNTEPIGTGPYAITDVLRTESGLIEAYKLEAFTASTQNPNITTLVFNFYQNEEELLTALEKKRIASTPSLSPENLNRINTKTYQIINTPLPRTFAIYFNQNKSPALRDDSVREALDVSIDKQQLIDSTLSGYAIPSDSPIPPGFLSVEQNQEVSTPLTKEQRRIQAEAILSDGGWTKTEKGTWGKEIDKSRVTLSVSLATANTPLFDSTATYLEETWEALGVEVSVSQFEQNDLVQAIIRPRDFEAVLYGVDSGRQTDLYPFWHSSQKNDPGLNIAAYTNIDVDALLQRLRMETDRAKWVEDSKKVAEIVTKERPAIFLFVTTFAYVLDTQVNASPLTKLGKPSERFATIARWHIKSNNVWPIFSNTKQ